MTDRPLESLGRIRIQALVLLAVVFVIGAFAGAVYEETRRPRMPEAPPRGDLPPQMKRELALTPDQERRIARILDDNQERTTALMDRIMPKLRALKDSIRVQVRAELTPAQQEIFDRFEPSFDAPPPGRPPHEGGCPPRRDDQPPPDPPPGRGDR